MTTAQSAEIAALREAVCALHAELVRNSLVAWTSGNVSARVGEMMVIKPSGVSYDELTPENMVVCGLDGKPVSADGLSPSSDTATHAYIYRHMPGPAGSPERKSLLSVPGSRTKISPYSADDYRPMPQAFVDTRALSCFRDTTISSIPVFPDRLPFG